MKHGTGDSAIYTCDFCGVSSRSGVSLFISPLDKQAAVCKPCVDGFPQVWGTVIQVVTRVSDLRTAEQFAAAARS